MLEKLEDPPQTAGKTENCSDRSTTSRNIK
jgi:hypothetical protein